jgi:putative Mg2+ transporter-C (MgtC) family protein
MEAILQSEIPPVEMAARLGVAGVLGLLLGMEREWRGKPAGLRTHMLVALGSAGFMLVGMSVLMATAQGDPSARIDPSRVVEGVIGGIGFLGAGSIIRSGASIYGITTGAAIWIAGAIGVASGIGNFPLAGMIAAFALVAMIVLGRFENEIIEPQEPSRSDKA